MPTKKLKFLNREFRSHYNLPEQSLLELIFLKFPSYTLQPIMAPLWMLCLPHSRFSAPADPNPAPNFLPNPQGSTQNPIRCEEANELFYGLLFAQGVASSSSL